MLFRSALLGLADPIEMERIAAKIVAEGLSVRATEELISIGAGIKKKGQQKQKLSSGKFLELEEKIGDSLDTRVRIKGGKTGGTIMIEFADSVDLQRIVNELT